MYWVRKLSIYEIHVISDFFSSVFVNWEKISELFRAIFFFKFSSRTRATSKIHISDTNSTLESKDYNGLIPPFQMSRSHLVALPLTLGWRRWARCCPRWRWSRRWCPTRKFGSWFVELRCALPRPNAVLWKKLKF